MGTPRRLALIVAFVMIALVLGLGGCAKTTESPAPGVKAPTQAEDIAAIKEVYAKETAALNALDASAMAQPGSTQDLDRLEVRLFLENL